MATTSERVDNNVNKEEEEKTLQSSSIDGEQGNKTIEKVDDLNQIEKTDTLSSVQSTNEDKKSDQISPTSDTNTEKTNEEKTVDTTTSEKKQEADSSTSTAITSSNSNNDQDSKKDQSTTVTSDDNNAFHIEKGDGEHLTDFQRQKAKYFFNVNLGMCCFIRRKKKTCFFKLIFRY